MLARRPGEGAATGAWGSGSVVCIASALRLGHRDGEPPWSKGFRLGPHQRAVLRPAQSFGREGWRHQRQRHAVEPGREVGWQLIAAAHRREQHLPAAEHGQHVAFVGAGPGTVAPVDGAGGAQASEARRGARPGAPPAMHAATEFAPDGRRAAGAAGAGARATARREREIWVAAALFRCGGRGRVRLVTGRNGPCRDDAGGHGKANPLVFAVCSYTRIPHVVARAIDRNQTPTAPPAKFLTRM
jgi:hypothetical protein